MAKLTYAQRHAEWAKESRRRTVDDIAALEGISPDNPHFGSELLREQIAKRRRSLEIFDEGEAELAKIFADSGLDQDGT